MQLDDFEKRIKGVLLPEQVSAEEYKRVVDYLLATGFFASYFTSKLREFRERLKIRKIYGEDYSEQWNECADIINAQIDKELGELQ